MSWIEPDIIDDETAVAEASLAEIAGRIPGWQPSVGHAETVITESTAVAIATAVVELKTSIADAYRGFGLRVLGRDRHAQTPAVATTTWTIDAGEERTFDAGSEADLTLPNGEQATFATIAPLTIAASPSPTVVTGVEMMSVDVGEDLNGATNPTYPSPVGVASVQVVSAASGGRDEEDDEDYINAIVDRARRLHVIPVTPEDYAALALDHPSIDRCAAVNRTDPGNPGDQPGHVTLYPLSAGAVPAPAIRSELAAMLNEAEKVVAAVAHVDVVAWQDIAVAITVKASAAAGGDLAADVEAAIRAGHDPDTFDADRAAAGNWLPADQRTTSVNVFTVAALVDDLVGVARITSITLNGDTSPITLAAPLTLPRITTVNVTVTP